MKPSIQASERNAAAGKSTPRVPPGYKQTEVGVIPEDWEVKGLNAVVGYTNGKAHEDVIREFGDYVVVNSKFISTDGHVKKYSGFCLLPATRGDVLMVMSDIPNGRAIARCFHVDADNRYTVNQRICRLRASGVDDRLLYYKLDRNPYYLAFDDGVKQTNLRKDEVLSCPLGLPPTLVEQEAIAEALSDADSLIDSLEQLIAKKRLIKQGAMHYLLTGKKRIPGFAEEWTETTIGQLCEIEPGDVTAGGENDYLEIGDVNVISKTYVTEGKTKQSVPGSVRVPVGTLLISRVRPTRGAIVVVNEERPVSSAFCRLKINSRFVFHVVCHDSFLDHLGEVSEGGTYPTCRPKDILDYPLLAPTSEAEQNAIAAILSDMDAELAALEAKLSKARQLKQGMMQELLTGKTRLV